MILGMNDLLRSWIPNYCLMRSLNNQMKTVKSTQTPMTGNQTMRRGGSKMWLVFSMPTINQLKFLRTTSSDQAGLTANEWNATRLDAPELNKAAVSNYVSSELCIVYQCIGINLKSLKQNKLLHLCTCLGNGACGHSFVRMLAWFRVAEPFFISFFLSFPYYSICYHLYSFHQNGPLLL